MGKADLDVEDILRGIRRRVVDKNRAMEDVSVPALVENVRETDASGERIQTYLATTDRLRGNLPPITTYRSGMTAKIELRIKSLIKRAMRWIVFDQVNFNSTVHEILGELHLLQIRQEEMLSEFRRTVELEASRREKQQSVINEEQSIINEEQSIINEGQSVFNEGQKAVNEEQGAINAKQRLVNEDQMAINESQTVVNEDQRAINKSQTVVNEDQRAVNESHSVVNEEQRAINEDLRAQLNESAIIIDRMRRNFEHRLTHLEKGDS